MITTAQDLVTQARNTIRETTPNAVAGRAPDVVLIDVREPAEFDGGHLEGAINIPRGVLEFQIESHPAVDGAGARDCPLVLYCRSGGRSALAAASLERMGFGNVQSMAGGLTAWVDAGLPVRNK